VAFAAAAFCIRGSGPSSRGFRSVRIFPREWNRFATAVPDTLRHLPLADAYATLLFDADPAVRDHAAREWCAWEDAHVSLTHLPNPRYEDPEFRLRFARLVTTPPSSGRINCCVMPRPCTAFPAS
jgi:hypothetical protein